MEESETATAPEAEPITAAIAPTSGSANTANTNQHDLGLDAPYTGAAGQTRFENVHLILTSGVCSSVPVCRVVNTQTHPELRDRAVAGTLHRLGDGRELALPFVFHDPEARKFALVLPAALAHTELKEWARLMDAIADDTQHPVPMYVRDSTTVIGWLALRCFMNADADVSAASPRATEAMFAELADREQLLARRERDLVEQERALTRMADLLTVRESEVLRHEDQIETARVDLELREQEMLEQQRARHEAVPLLGGTSWTPVGVVNTPPPEQTEEAVEALAAAGGAGATSGSRPPPLPGLRFRSAPPPLPLRSRLQQRPPPLAGVRSTSSTASDAELAVPDSELPARQVPSVPPPLPHAPPSARSARSESEVPPPATPRDAQPEVAPPPHFRELRVGQMTAKLVDDELWLFAHIDEQRSAAYRQGIELYVQYVELEGYPVVLLSAVHQSHEAQALRTALDGYSHGDQRVLEHLSRSFRARIALYVGGLYLDTTTVASLREGVAQAISERLSLLPSERPTLISTAEALARVQHDPPSLTNDDLPFGPARREASTTATVQAAVEQLSSWLRPEKLAEATLTYCVPRNVIDATLRRVLRAAVAFGIALPEDLVQRAVEHRAARDVPSMLRTQLAGFKHRVEQGENDLGATATRKNWEQLLALAAEHEVEVDDATRSLVIAPPTRPSQRPPSTRPPRPLQMLSSNDLRARLKNPPERLEAIRELCVRGHAASLELVLGALHTLNALELPPAVACLLAFGDAAGDGLIAALQAPDPRLRQLAALALGRLKLRRALLPLLKQLEVEASDIHPELSRALGDFGPAAVRPLARAHALATGDQSERLIAAMAHVANHGAAKEVERLENDADGSVAQAARRAMAKRSRLEWEDLAVREQRSLGEGQAPAQLSQAFYAELTKVAI
jgi:hypothetical protein